VRVAFGQPFTYAGSRLTTELAEEGYTADHERDRGAPARAYRGLRRHGDENEERAYVGLGRGSRCGVEIFSGTGTWASAGACGWPST